MQQRTGESFGDLLRRHRLRCGWTQVELAERARISVEAVSTLERGARRAPWPGTVARLATALQLTPEEQTALIDAPRVASGQPTEHLPHGALRSGIVPTSPADDPKPGSDASPAVPDTAPFVGRSEELAAIERQLAGYGPDMVVLAGEPGMGKSRLLREAERRARDGGLTVLAGGCQRRDAHEPYAPILAALQQYIGKQQGDTLQTVLQGCAWLVRLLPELADGPLPSLPAWAVSPDQERRLIVESIIRFLSNIAGPKGALLVLDDLQWAGPDAVGLLATLARASLQAPLKILAAYRDTDVQPNDPIAVTSFDLAASGKASTLQLRPLTDQNVMELLDGALGPGVPIKVAVRERVLQRAGGVPFYVLSFAQSLSVGGDPASTVPDDVGQSVRQRVVALRLSARRVLSAAAVVGRVIRPDLVVGAAGLPEEDVLDALDELCRARLLEETDSGEYRFVHDVIWEVVEADLGAARRKMLHRRVAEGLERAPIPPVRLLAYHYSRSDDRAKAVRFLELAGDQAEAQHAHASAAGYYADLLELLDELGRAPEAAPVCEKLGGALHRAARYDAALSVLERAATEFHALGDGEGELRAVAQCGFIHAARGTQDQGTARIHSTLDRPGHPAPSPGLAALQLAVAQLFNARGEYPQALKAAERSVDIARACGDIPGLGAAVAAWGDYLIMVGRFDDALVAAQEAAQLAEAAGDLGTLCTVHRATIGTHINKGDLVKARLAGDRAVEVAEQLNDPEIMALARASRALVTMLTGQWDLAATDLETALAQVRPIGSAATTRFVLTGYGRYCLYTGDWDQAVRCLEETIAMDDHEEPGAHGFLAELDLASGRPDRARARLTPFFERDDKNLWVNEIRPLLARACLELGELGRAEQLIADQIRWVQETGKKQGSLEALRVRGMIAARRRRWEDACRDFAEAAALAREISIPYGEARILNEWANMHIRKGEPQQARQRLDECLAIFRRLGARKDVERVADQVLAMGSGNVPAGRGP